MTAPGAEGGPVTRPLPGSIPAGKLREKAGSVEALGLTGIVFAALSFTGTLLVRDMPDWTASPAAVRTWLDDSGNRTKVVTADYLALFASVALLWFIGTLRRRIGTLEDQLFATVFLGSGLVFIAVYLAGFGALTVPVTLYQHGATDTAVSAFQPARALGSNLLTVVATRVSALLMLSLSNLGRITRAFPSWLVLFGIIAALVLLVGVTFGIPITWVLPAWTLVVGLVILRRRKQIPVTAAPPGSA